jgi:DNA-binding Lrp family transcriptional regulator
MHKLDEQEKLIVREIIRNPKISDNKISLRTNVPLKTVNRKRKILEKNNLLNYYCYLDNTLQGTGTFSAKMMLVIVFRDGITRKTLLEKMSSTERALRFFPKHVLFTMVGEFEGNVAIITIIESHKAEDLIEIYNAEFVPELEMLYGRGCIKKTLSLPITHIARIFRNYIPGRNMANGVIREDWSNDYIFVD